MSFIKMKRIFAEKAQINEGPGIIKALRKKHKSPKTTPKYYILLK